MKLGISRNIITPRSGVGLAGFSIPGRNAAGVHDDLYLSTLVLEHAGRKAVVIAADIIGFAREFVVELKEAAKQRFGFNEDEMLFNASHTHSGPQTLYNMTPAAGVADEGYLSFLRSTVMSSIESALCAMEETDVYYGKTQCDIGVNRRKIVDGKAEWAPYEAGAADKDVTVVKFSKDGKAKAVLFNYACHPSTVDTMLVSADYPGKARKVIENSFGNQVTAVFLQGCCGNIRVRTVDNGAFRAGTFDDVERFGEELGLKVLEACKGEMKKLTPVLSSAVLDFKLDLRNKPDIEEIKGLLKLDSEDEKLWAGQILANYGSLMSKVPYTVQRLSFGDDLLIVGMDGEICVEYGLNVKQMCEGKTVVTAGYCNGIAGYIPTAEMFDQGGYEPDTSKYCYMLPAQFTGNIETHIMKQLGIILR